MTDKEIRVRIAPSPTGDPHVGTAYIGLLNYCFAKHNNGKFILRIEDTDQSRCSMSSQIAIFESLKWLGLNYDEGPDVGGEYGPYIQSDRVKLGIYKKYAQQLIDQGDAYYCFCNESDLKSMRKMQEMNGQPPMYDRRCRALSQEEIKQKLENGHPYVIRMKCPLEGKFVYKDRLRKNPFIKEWKEIDDQVLLKSDGWPTYHLAAVVDDHLMKISHVIRAEEWLNSLPKHIWLNEKLGFDAPEYVHVGLLRNADKSKISKRKNPTNLLWYRSNGILPKALINFLALLGHSHPNGNEIFSLEEMVSFFDLNRINVSGPVFDFKKLKFIQSQYFKTLSNDDILKEVHNAIDSNFTKLIPLFKERMSKGGDFLNQCEPFFSDTINVNVNDLLIKDDVDKSKTKYILEKLQTYFKDYTSKDNFVWSSEKLEHYIKTFIEENGKSDSLAELWTFKNIFMILRVAVTGRKDTPPLFQTLEVLGHIKVIERIGIALQKLR